MEENKELHEENLNTTEQETLQNEENAVSYTHLDVYKRQKGISVKYDDRTEYKPGWKFAEYELKGCLLYTSRCV